MFYTYIIYSKSSDTYYTGHTGVGPEKRLERHNKGWSQSTKASIPWQLKILQEDFTKPTCHCGALCRGFSTATEAISKSALDSMRLSCFCSSSSVPKAQGTEFPERLAMTAIILNFAKPPWKRRIKRNAIAGPLTAGLSNELT